MVNQYEEIIKLKSSVDRQKALEFIKDIHLEWRPQRNMIVNGLTITFFANGEHEFGRLSNASLRFAEQFGFRDKNNMTKELPWVTKAMTACSYTSIGIKHNGMEMINPALVKENKSKILSQKKKKDYRSR